MALTNNFISPTSLVFGVRDFLPQIESNQKQDREGLQNAFKFATQVYDFSKNREVADAIKKGDFEKAAVADAQRINNQDPTSIFRWKLGQEQAKQLHDETLAAQQAQQESALKRTEAEKALHEQKSKDAIINEVTNTLPTMSIGMETTPEQRQQYLNTLAALKTKAQNAGIPIEMITRKEEELAGELPSIKLQNSYTNFENMSDLFDKKADAGGYANNLKSYKDAVWNEWMAHPEFHDIPAYRQAFIKAMNAHNPVQKKPGTKPSKRK